MSAAGELGARQLQYPVVWLCAYQHTKPASWSLHCEVQATHRLCVLLLPVLLGLLCCHQAPPPSWCCQLACLDLSGQVSVSDDVLGTTLVSSSSSSLRALSIADTSAGPLTFMLWPPRSTAASAQTAAPSPATSAGHSASLHARLRQGFSLLPQQQQQQQAEQAQQAQQAEQAHQFQQQAEQVQQVQQQVQNAQQQPQVQQQAQARGLGTPPASTARAGPPPSSVPGELPPPCCLLQVLDVSGCASLAVTGPTAAAGSSVFRLFQASLAALPHLEGVWAGNCES